MKTVQINSTMDCLFDGEPQGSVVSTLLNNQDLAADIERALKTWEADSAARLAATIMERDALAKQVEELAEQVQTLTSECDALAVASAAHATEVAAVKAATAAYLSTHGIPQQLAARVRVEALQASIETLNVKLKEAEAAAG